MLRTVNLTHSWTHEISINRERAIREELADSYKAGIL
jgi:hypothetical protein